MHADRHARRPASATGSAICVYATMPSWAGGTRRGEKYATRKEAADGIRQARRQGGTDINVLIPADWPSVRLTERPGSAAWLIEGKHPRLWKGWAHLMTTYGRTRTQAKEDARRAMAYYEGVSHVRVRPLNVRLTDGGPAK